MLYTLKKYFVSHATILTVIADPKNSNIIATAVCIIRPKLCIILLNHHTNHTDNSSLSKNAKCQGDCFIQSDVLELDSGRLDAKVLSFSWGACTLSQVTNVLLS